MNAPGGQDNAQTHSLESQVKAKTFKIKVNKTTFSQGMKRWLSWWRLHIVINFFL